MSGRRLALPRGRFLELDGPAIVMGILNATPDSFYGASRVQGTAAAVDRAAAMIGAGAAILDVGGESTRPGSEYVDAGLEAERVVPVVEAIRARWDVAVSVDTRKASVAEAAIDAGADIVNDVAALGDDPAMAGLCAAKGVPVVLMHKKGVPSTMQAGPLYEDCLREVGAFLSDAVESAEAAGIRSDAIVLDPGIGFGKRLEDNLELLRRLDGLKPSGYPILVGLSRKAFVGAITGEGAEGRLAGSLAAACAARARGAAIFRVHDVRETVEALAVFDASYGPAGRRA